MVAVVGKIEGRDQMPDGTFILIGEYDYIGDDDLQDRLGSFIHGEADWATLRLPSSMAGVGAWAQDKAEPLIPDALDQGERPFIQPFMTRMASDHYALDVSRAHTLLGWQPKQDRKSTRLNSSH